MILFHGKCENILFTHFIELVLHLMILSDLHFIYILTFFLFSLIPALSCHWNNWNNEKKNINFSVVQNIECQWTDEMESSRFQGELKQKTMLFLWFYHIDQFVFRFYSFVCKVFIFIYEFLCNSKIQVNAFPFGQSA